MKKILFILLTLFTLNSFTINAQIRNLKENRGIVTILLDLLFCRSAKYEKDFDFYRLNDSYENPNSDGLYSSSEDFDSSELELCCDETKDLSVKPDTSSDAAIARVLSDDMHNVPRQAYLCDTDFIKRPMESKKFKDLSVKPDATSDEAIAKALSNDMRSLSRQEDSCATNFVENDFIKRPMEFVGFKDSYNTCYANASLQLLMNAPGFGRFLNRLDDFSQKEPFIVSELKKLYNAYTCDTPYCSDDARLNIIKAAINSSTIKNKGAFSYIEFGKPSSSDIFIVLLVNKLLSDLHYDSLSKLKKTSLYQKLKLFDIILDEEEYADAVILHVNGNHFIIKFRVDRNHWTVIDGERIIHKINSEEIERIYSNIFSFMSVRYL